MLLRTSSAYLYGSVHDVCNMLRECCACTSNLCQSCSGNCQSIAHIPAIKWLLKVCIAISAALTLWSCGSMSWRPICSSYRNVLIVCVVMLSIMLNVGQNPILVKYSIFCLKTIITASSLELHINSMRMELVFQSCEIKIKCLSSDWARI